MMIARSAIASISALTGLSMKINRVDMKTR